MEETMIQSKSVLWVLLAVGVVLAVGWTPQAASPVASLAAPQVATPGTVTVTGEAEMRIVPDEVIIRLGVETSDKSLSKAKQQNDQIVKKVYAVAQKYGVSQNHIQTDYIHIEPRYDGYAQREFIGYFVQNTIAITLRDLAQFEGLLGATLESGVNYVQSIEFRTTDLRRYRDEARALALRAAQEKAAAMTGELGQALGEPRNIQELANDWWSGYSSWWWSNSSSMTQNVIQEVNGSAAEYDSSLAPGQLAVKARVSVSFEMTPKP